jgi:hypothetical protein
MAAKALGYLLHHKTTQESIRGIPLAKLDARQMVNGYFADDSFLTILEDREFMENMLGCI